MSIPNKYKCIPFWSWNEKLNSKTLIEQIKWMERSGVGGFFMHARTGLTTPYLGKEWFEAIDACKQEAKKLNMHAFAYDENGWPSGFAGGALLKNKDNCDTFLTYQIGKCDKNAYVSYDLSSLKPVKQGKQCINIYLHISSGTVDICNPHVVKQFIDLTHEQYLKRDKNHQLKGFFTDEPQLYRWSTSYSRMLPNYFKDVYHENILDRLYLLFIEKSGYRDFRYKYYKALQTLMLKSYAEQIYTWCDKHNYQLTGHYVEESYLGLQLQCTAGIMPFYEYEHIPGCDWLGRNIGRNSLTGKQLGSVASQLNKEQVICEMYAGCGWDTTPLEYKHIAEHLYVDGINLMCQHLLPYNERGNRKHDYPGHFIPLNPWVKKSFKEFNDYFSNLGYFLAKSKMIVHAAMLHPIRSCYFDFKNTLRQQGYGVANIDEALHQAITTLDNNHIPFHFVDETLLAKYGSVKDGKIICGHNSYTYLLLPKIYTMDQTTEKLIKEFVKQGGKIYLFDAAPTYLEGKPHRYPYLKSNVSLMDLKKAYPFISKPNPNFRISYRLDKKSQPYLYVVNLGEANDLTIEYKGSNGFKCGKEIFDNNIHFEKYESKILYPTKLAKIKDEPLTNLYLSNKYQVVGKVNNYLTLDCLSYSFDNKRYSPIFHHGGVFMELLNKRYNGDVYLKYQFNIKSLPKICNALIEDMNTKTVYINNHLVKINQPSDFLNSYSISKYLKAGLNAIVVKIKYYQSQEVYDVMFDKSGEESLRNCLVFNTNIEPIYLLGDFGVYGDFKDGKTSNVVIGDNFYIDKPKSVITDLIRDGYPFFAGDIHLRQIIDIDNKNSLLTFKERFHLIDVYVNKKYVAQLMFTNKVDLSKYLTKGKNTIDLILTIGNRNLFGPFHDPMQEPPFNSPETFERTHSWNKNKNPYYQTAYSFVKTII